jgi:small-conductance mechanosensitive channel
MASEGQARESQIAGAGFAATVRRSAHWTVAVAVAAFAAMAEAAGTETQAPVVVREGLPVRVANRQIIILRGPIAGYTAEDRVTGTLERIEQALEAEQWPGVATEDTPEGTRVLLGGKHAFLVTKLDIDEQAGETTQLVAQEAAKRLQRAIGELREQETPRFLAMAAVFSGLATLIFGVLLWLTYRANQWISRHLSAAAAIASTKVIVGGIRVLDTAQVLTLARRLVVLAAWVFGIFLATTWLTYVLAQFPYSRPWGEHLEGNLLDVVKQIVVAIVEAVPGLLFVVLIFVIARAVVRTTAVFFERVAQGRIRVGWLDADTAMPTRRISSFIVWVFALGIAYPYLPGAQTEGFKGLSVLVGLMISIGGASVVGQAFSGLILMYTHAFRAGDYVRVGDTEGTVIELGLFATRVRTGLGDQVTLPNAMVTATVIRNYSRVVPGTGYMVDTAVTIGYSTPWRQVHAMLEEAARRTSNIAERPPPVVRQTSLSDFYVEYRLIAYTALEEPAARVDVLNRLHGSIQDVFNEHGVQIMSPHYMMDPKEPHVVPKDRWYASPAQPRADRGDT